MSRPHFRHDLRLEGLETRELLSSGGPTDQQQYMLYLLNEARTNPAEMADRVTSNLNADVKATLAYYKVDLPSVKNTLATSTPKPPLAWSSQLADAAQGQSQYQADTGIQSHTGANGSNLESRLDQAGYTNRTSNGENAYAYSDSVDEAMQAFLIDWGVASNGHRNNILQPGTSSNDSYREVGIGIVKTSRRDFGPYVITQDFGAQKGDKAQLLGVAFNDPKGTGGYTLGQGVGDVTIQATNETTGKTSTVQTWDSGGYQMPLDPGQYEVTASVGNKVVKSQDVQVGSVNVEVDYNLSQPWQGTTLAATSAPATTSAPVSTPPRATPPAPTTSTTSSSAAVQAPVTTLASKGTPNTDASWTSSWTSWSAKKH